jgi:hypothetical protein
MGEIDMHPQQLHPRYQQNNIPFQPLNIKKLKHKKERHKTLKQTLKQLFKLPKKKKKRYGYWNK